ncbi:GntR family transcriptional regulator [Jannaschia sp. EhC01]|uniref:Pyruvate dehydrogenase complex repressor n=1 Tax=Gymnodinialimonas phycosphaerae TaxID=2841589 RepID=A0A975TVQ6_9RHOB|nr:FCD domain-containing protein [Gymnodinialimonas phycosphaerae]MBY4891485.1 FCD domain-containing protein [Gymnodinialimonas phycosphaerae]OAN84486.1 GntR family transcriptional regulator [Jannaschia sp. EhC01]
MPFQRIEAEKLSRSVVKQIEQLILRGILRPGERLPSERELSERLSVSRPSLREAVAELQERGLLATRAGAGIYVADVIGSAFSPALIDLLSAHEEAVFDYISFRQDLESIAAERAAIHGSDTDLKVIDTIFRKMEVAHRKRNPTDEAELDAEFHLAIIEASHNVILLHMMRASFNLLRQGVFFNRQQMFKNRTTRDILLDQHRAINAGIQERDAEAAKAAVIQHLDYVKEEMNALKASERNEEIARLRYAHERER